MRVGSSPRENMSLRMLDAISVWMPDDRGAVTTIAMETNIAVQTRPDRRGSSSEKVNSQCKFFIFDI